MKLLHYFSEEELQKIEQTVKTSEACTSGEIVPVFVENCSEYPNTIYKVALFALLISYALVAVVDYFLPALHLHDPLWYITISLVVSIISGVIVYFSPALQRLFIGRTALFEAAFWKAEHFFLREEVFNTEQRTGIMIFVAFFEHQVIVRADRGINKVVPQERWNEVVDLIIDAIKKEEMTDGITKGIERCAKILEENEFIITPDDIDELPNSLRTD